MKFNNEKLIDLAIVYLIFILGSFFSHVVGVGLMGYNLLVLLPTLLFLYFKNGITSKKVFIQGLVIGIFAEVLIDVFALSSNAWQSPTIFPFTILNMPLENIFWVVLFVITIILIYEYFFDSNKSENVPTYNKYWLIVAASVSFAVAAFYYITPSIFVVSYFYTVLMVFLVIFDILFFPKYQRIVLKSFLMSLILLPLAFIHEITSLENKHWIFEQGNHLFYVNFLSYQIPIEEITFYIAAPIAIVIFYELLADNQNAG